MYIFMRIFWSFLLGRVFEGGTQNHILSVKKGKAIEVAYHELQEFVLAQLSPDNEKELKHN